MARSSSQAACPCWRKWRNSSPTEMSPAFNITRYTLLALVAVSLGTWGVRTWTSDHSSGGVLLPRDGVVVVNFHTNTRCNACLEIGTEAQAVVETNFATDLRSGRMNWRVINF